MGRRYYCQAIHGYLQVNETREMGASRAFQMAWCEQAGPEVSGPQRTGFGSVVISQMLERSLDGKAKLNFRPSGVEWLFECPAASVMDG